MVDKRNRILELTAYLESLGIKVNIEKNKARGNKGFFKVIGDNYRIDIAKGQNDDEKLHILAHEFAHYFHFLNDKSLKSLDFIFPTFNEEILEELINLTVDSIPKSSVKVLFESQEHLKDEISDVFKILCSKYPDINLNKPYKRIENRLKFPYNNLLKYDKVKIFNKIYTISDVKDDDLLLYLKLKSKKRALTKINSKISRLNKYYNTSTELFARAFEYYALKKDVLINRAPNVYKSFLKLDNSLLNDFLNILK